MTVISRLTRLLGFTLLATFAWKLLRRRRLHPVYTPSYEAPYVLEQQAPKRNPWRTDATAAFTDTLRTSADAGRRASRALAVAARWLWARRSRRPVPPADLDLGRVEFEWLVRMSDPTRVRRALEAAGVSFDVLDPHTHDREDVVAERLEAVGMHLDEGGHDGGPQEAIARYAGVTSPRRLADAFEQALTEAHTGFIVDASTTGPVVIDEHQTVGSGVLALLEPSQARLTHGERGRAFLRAVRAVAERGQGVA